MLAARTVIITGIDAHGAARYAILAESDARRHALFDERAIPGIPVQLVRLSIVGYENVGPAVVVVIDDRHAEGLAGGIADAGLRRHVFEPAAAEVVIELGGSAFIGFGSAIGLGGAV